MLTLPEIDWEKEGRELVGRARGLLGKHIRVGHGVSLQDAA